MIDALSFRRHCNACLTCDNACLTCDNAHNITQSSQVLFAFGFDNARGVPAGMVLGGCMQQLYPQ